MKVNILGVQIDNLKEEEIFEVVRKKIEKREKFWLATPNPEFIVLSQKDPEFKKILNSANFAIPDGQGLILASRILKTRPLLSKRVAGSDLVFKLLKEASEKSWRVGIVGARRGDKKEIRVLIRRLKEKFPGAEIKAFELTKNWLEQKFEIVFACQGMKFQEKWIWENLKKTNASFFMGIGGSLDFLAGFSKRAPSFIRNLGLEWFWRLIFQPWRWRRQLNLLRFIWLVFKTRLP